MCYYSMYMYECVNFRILLYHSIIGLKLYNIMHKKRRENLVLFSILGKYNGHGKFI